MFGVITGMYWIILDLAVLVVAIVTAINLWRFTKNENRKAISEKK